MIRGSIQEENIKNYKYLCTQHRCTSIHKVNANTHKRGNQQQHNNSDFNTPLIPMDGHPDRKLIRKHKL